MATITQLPLGTSRSRARARRLEVVPTAVPERRWELDGCAGTGVVAVIENSAAGRMSVIVTIEGQEFRAEISNRDAHDLRQQLWNTVLRRSAGSQLRLDEPQPGQ